MTPVYKRFITDKQYRNFSAEARRWYKPYRCSACARIAELDRTESEGR